MGPWSKVCEHVPPPTADECLTPYKPIHQLRRYGQMHALQRHDWAS